MRSSSKINGDRPPIRIKDIEIKNFSLFCDLQVGIAKLYNILN